MDSPEALELELKRIIIESLMLEDIQPHDIDSDQPLFNEGLGLDSIDALELGMAIAKTYRIRMSQSPEENAEHFASVKNLARFVRAQMDEMQDEMQESTDR